MAAADAADAAMAALLAEEEAAAAAEAAAAEKRAARRAKKKEKAKKGARILFFSPWLLYVLYVCLPTLPFLVLWCPTEKHTCSRLSGTFLQATHGCKPNLS